VSLFDTRFFFEHYYSSDGRVLERTKARLKVRGRKCISSVTVHELYKLMLEKEGDDVAELRVNLLCKEMEVLPVDAHVAKLSAQLRSKHRMPMADSMIAATSSLQGLSCVTDDPHISEALGRKSAWI
jgi:predicted nucleic acid-binding protein